MNCDFPKHSPTPGGVINIPIKDNAITSPINDEIYLCKESENLYKIIFPISLEFSQEKLKLNITKSLYKEVSINKKESKLSRVQITKNEFIKVSNTNNIRAYEEMLLTNKILRTSSDSIHLRNLKMIKPVSGIISSEFGARRVVNDQPRKPHSGVDIAAEIGSQIVAPLEGKILLIEDFFYRGKVIFIDHGKDLISTYSHLSKVNVKLNDLVSQGMVIGEVGKTGRVTGAHLHWQILLNGTAINPALFLD